MKSKLLIFLILLVCCLQLVKSNPDCSKYNNQDDCLEHRCNCGWCGNSKTNGTCLAVSDEATCHTTWYSPYQYSASCQRYENAIKVVASVWVICVGCWCLCGVCGLLYLAGDTFIKNFEDQGGYAEIP